MMIADLSSRSFNETQQRILDAAVACVRQWGVDKTNLNDIAKQAGVTRPTVYRYFADRNEVLSTALLRGAYSLAQRALAHVARWSDPAERYLESALFFLEAMPREPYLSTIMTADFSAFVSQDALHNAEGRALTLRLMREILAAAPLSDAEIAEINEITIRMVLSLLLMPGPEPRSRDDLRDFLKRRLVPMLGLPRP